MALRCCGRAPGPLWLCQVTNRPSIANLRYTAADAMTHRGKIGRQGRTYYSSRCSAMLCFHNPQEGGPRESVKFNLPKRAEFYEVHLRANINLSRC